MNSLKKRSFVHWLIFLVLIAALLAGCTAPAVPANTSPAADTQPAASSEPITLGVSGPLTGNNARYGAQWKKGFDLALDEINGAGGIDGRKLEYVFEDLQS